MEGGPPFDAPASASSLSTAVAASSDSSPVELLPDEILCLVLSRLDPKTLMIAVPQVCRRWRRVCPCVRQVHLDFSGRKKQKEEGPKVPVEALAGWPAPAVLATAGWRSGLCELFPLTTRISLCSTSVADAHVLAVASKCKGLTRADFGGCENLTDAAAVALADNCSALTWVNLSNCRRVTGAAALALATECSLEHADFERCCNLTAADVIAFASKCPALTWVNFYYNARLTDAAVAALAANCRGLTHVAFSNNENITDAALVALANSCTGLQSLRTWECRNITDAGVVAIADKCPDLRVLNVSFSEVTGASVAVLAVKCRGITHAIFEGCVNLTDDALTALAEHCPGLTCIRCRGCPKVTSGAKAAVRERRPRCKVFCSRGI